MIPSNYFVHTADYRLTTALCILKMLSQLSSRPHPCVGNSLPVPSGGDAPPTSGDIESLSEEAAKLAMKAVEAFLSSQDHNDIEGSQYQLVSEGLQCVYIRQGKLNSHVSSLPAWIFRVYHNYYNAVYRYTVS